MTTPSSRCCASLRLARLAAGLLAVMAGACARAQGSDAVEQTSARYQITYNAQRHAAFPAPYSGQNSLLSSRGRMHTFSATAHLGMRVGEATELYFNPELAAGVPFSGQLVGLGGFTNGEITRAAGTEPKPYVQRLFLRHTWGQGGGREHREGGFNQLAGSVDRDRIVLTAGNFSTLDVFDDNRYAKDPRSQFMNWSHWTHAAWDYAADARGFGWGAALEVYRGDWAVRVARMTGPKEPNGMEVDLALGKHYGDQVELERAHTVMGRAGKLRVLAYRNRAVLARFTDATARLATHPSASAQTIFSVRHGEQTKSGLGVNLEQALSDDVGVFFRWMRSDGKTETYAFTEADASLSTGVLLQGERWGRPGDSLGLAFARNSLSPDRRRYLEAGGISFFIGDGALNYRPEAIIETFYSLRLVRGVWLTGDAQRIQHPAYNASRGPVNVLALRVHAEF